MGYNDYLWQIKPLNYQFHHVPLQKIQPSKSCHMCKPMEYTNNPSMDLMSLILLGDLFFCSFDLLFLFTVVGSNFFICLRFFSFMLMVLNSCISVQFFWVGFFQLILLLSSIFHLTWHACRVITWTGTGKLLLQENFYYNYSLYGRLIVKKDFVVIFLKN